MATPWCTPVSQVISSLVVQSTVSAALTAAGLAKFLSVEVRGRYRCARSWQGKPKMFKGEIVHMHQCGGHSQIVKSDKVLIKYNETLWFL